MKEKDLMRLIERARKGDANAFAEIYSIFSPSVYHLGLKLLKNEHDANDVVQETMLKLYSNLGSLRKAGAIKGYVNRIAYNSAIDIIRKRKGEFLEDDEELMESFSFEADTDFVPEEYLETKERRDFVVDLVDQLSVEQRSAILLFYYEDLSIREIAEIQEVSENVVKSRLFRARSTLKERLGRSDGKGVVSAIAITTILGKILTLDAKASFSPAVSAANWQAVAKSIGYSPEVIEATTKIATKPGGSSSSSASSSVAISGKVIALVTAGALAVSGVVYGGYRWLVPPTKTGGEPLATFQRSAPSVSGPSATFPDAPPAEEPAPSTQQPPTEGERAEESHPPPLVAMEEGTDIPSAAMPETATLSSKEYFLTYPSGTSVSAQQLLEDAGVEYTGAGEITLLYYEEIDFSTPNDYAVLVIPADDQVAVSPIALIISIE